MGWQQAFANSCDRALGFCIGNFSEYALRRSGNAAWVSRAGGHDFLCRVSTVAASGRDGVLPSSLLPRCADGRTAPFRPTEHDQRRFLRHSGRAWCGFRDSNDRPLLPSVRGRRTASTGDCHIGGKTWTRCVFRRAHDRSRLSRSGAEWRHELLRAGSTHSHRHFRGWSVHVLHLVFVCQG